MPDENKDNIFARISRAIAPIASLVGTLVTLVSNVNKLRVEGPPALAFAYSLFGYIGVIALQTLGASVLCVFAVESFWTSKFGDKGIVIGVACIGIVELFMIVSGAQDVRPFFFYPWLPPLIGFCVAAYTAYIFLPFLRSKRPVAGE